MLCHSCDTILPQMWHNSRTAVKRSTHSCGTTYFFERIIYFFGREIYFLGKRIYFLGEDGYFFGAARIFFTSVRKASASR